MEKYDVIKRVTNDKVVAVVRGTSVEIALEKSRACIEGGIKLIELTFTVPHADRAIADLIARYGDEVVVGAGTVLDAITARIAIMAGAQFIVSPGFDEETAKLCNLYHVPYMAGCMTISEMIKASRFGVDIIKLFPGSQFGPSFIKGVLGPLPQLKIMPTGGVDLDNARDWLTGGAVALGVGSSLTKGDFAQIKSTAQAFKERVTGGAQ